MRQFALILSVLAILCVAVGARAGTLAPPGPNPNWTDMQKFEWYLGYMARAGRTCGSYVEADVLHRLARMSPYGDIGLGSVTGDGFAGPACGRINNEAKELAADSKKIQEYLEATYNCTAEGCYGQKLSDWKFHACADQLVAYLASRSVSKDDLREITITNVRNSGATLDYQARIRLKSCQGSLYVNMRESCWVERDFTRGDCEVAGVSQY